MKDLDKKLAWIGRILLETLNIVVYLIPIYFFLNWAIPDNFEFKRIAITVLSSSAYLLPRYKYKRSQSSETNQ